MKVEPELRKRIQVDEARITTMRVDAIVNTPHASLLTGEGVHWPIHQVAGPELLEACRIIGGCPPGHAEITPGYRLPARWVIHAVCPYLHGNELPTTRQERLLANCYGSCFDLCVEYGIRTIAFPPVATALSGFPRGQADRIALNETVRFLRAHTLPAEVIFVFGGEGWDFTNWLHDYFEEPDQ